MTVTITTFPAQVTASEPFVLAGTATDEDDGNELLILVDDRFEVARPRVQSGQWEANLVFNQTGDRKVAVIASDQDKAEISIVVESGDIDIINRVTWGAQSPSNPLANLPNPRRITIHHTVFPTLSPTATQTTEVSRIQSIQSSEMSPPQSFSDIGYHYVIMPSGRIYEGRPNGKRGAHDVFNDGFGVALDGSFHLDGSRIADEQFNSAVALCTQLCKQIGITDPTTEVPTPISKVGEPSPKNLPTIVGHRDRINTLCPGMEDGSNIRLDEIRQQVKARL